MKTVSIFLVISLFFITGCQTTWNPDSGIINNPDPETVAIIAQLTLELIELRNEYALARQQQDIQKQLEILVLIMEKIQQISATR